jgi:hypothetical protein
MRANNVFFMMRKGWEETERGGRQRQGCSRIHNRGRNVCQTVSATMAAPQNSMFGFAAGGCYKVNRHER